jgi:hypothetical protein
MHFHMLVTLQHRQGWFTYSYCHNKAIRQFKELAQPASRLPGPSSPLELFSANFRPRLYTTLSPILLRCLSIFSAFKALPYPSQENPIAWLLLLGICFHCSLLVANFNGDNSL